MLQFNAETLKCHRLHSKILLLVIEIDSLNIYVPNWSINFSSITEALRERKKGIDAVSFLQRFHV